MMKNLFFLKASIDVPENAEMSLNVPKMARNGEMCKNRKIDEKWLKWPKYAQKGRKSAIFDVYWPIFEAKLAN